MAHKVIILYRLYMPYYFLGTFTEYPIFRQKNKRTKEFIEYSNVCSSELDVHLFIQCCASAMLGALLYFCMEEQKEVGIYSCCYGVIPGWDQESN